MFGRVAAVMILVVSGFAIPATGQSQALGFRATEAATTGAQADTVSVSTRRPRSTVSGSYRVLASGQVQVAVTSNAKKVRLSFRDGSGRLRKLTIKIRSGAGSRTLPNGSTAIAARALSTKKLRASTQTVLAPAPDPSVGAPGSGATGGGATGAGPVTWRILMLVFRQTDTNYRDLQGNIRHLSTALTQPDIDSLRSAMDGSIRPAVQQWSNNQVTWDVEFAFPTAPISSVTPLDSQSSWVSPNDIQAALAQYYRPGFHDDVMVYWRNSDDSGNSIPSQGWGYGMLQPGYGYASVFSLGGGWNASSADVNTQVWIHEWLHSTSQFFSNLGYRLPANDADGAVTAGYSPEQPPYPGWGTYYSALMTNRVLQGGQYVGIPGEAWRSAKPSGSSDGSTGAGRILGGLDLNSVCQQQYAAGYEAHYRDFNDPYSWYCQPPSNSTNLPGGLDLDRACVSTFGIPSEAALSEHNAYGWFCRSK